MAKTNYTVLKAEKTEGRELLSVVGEAEAKNAQEAIREVAVTLSDPSGGYAAVPTRSFTTLTVKARQQTILDLA